jgi:hypothetical protein
MQLAFQKFWHKELGLSNLRNDNETELFRFTFRLSNVTKKICVSRFIRAKREIFTKITLERKKKLFAFHVSLSQRNKKIVAFHVSSERNVTSKRWNVDTPTKNNAYHSHKVHNELKCFCWLIIKSCYQYIIQLLSCLLHHCVIIYCISKTDSKSKSEPKLSGPSLCINEFILYLSQAQ